MHKMNRSIKNNLIPFHIENPFATGVAKNYFYLKKFSKKFNLILGIYGKIDLERFKFDPLT